MAFYGRKEELSVLKEALDKKGFRGILLWGRRHIGKSTLISEAIKNFDGLVVYYQCLKADDATNLQGLLAAYALGSAYSGSLHFGDIADFFEFVLEREKNRKVVFILDEYPYWRETSPLGNEGLDSSLQRAIDRVLSQKNCKLIVSGSYLGIMEQIQAEKNPLGGRFKTKLFLKALNYFEASSFYPAYSPAEKIAAYAALGGRPFLLEEIDPQQSLENNLRSLYFSSEGSLRKLMPLLVDDELGKSDILYRVFALLCTRVDKPSLADIASCFPSLSKEWIRRSLFELMDMQLVQRVFPLDENDKERNAYYQVADNGLAYYFRCVKPFESLVLLNAGEAAYEKATALFRESLLSKTFEQIAAVFLRLTNGKRKTQPLMDLGTYFYHCKGQNGEFDVVSKDEKGYIFFECKMHALTEADYHEELRQVEALPPFAIHPYALGFFGLSKGELASKKDLLVFDAADLYRI